MKLFQTKEGEIGDADLSLLHVTMSIYLLIEWTMSLEVEEPPHQCSAEEDH